MTLYRKKPVVIQAMQYLPSDPDAVERLADWLWDMTDAEYEFGDTELKIGTLEDGQNEFQVEHVASDGDWIIRGVAGEVYACKDEIFAATYEPVENA